LLPGINFIDYNSIESLSQISHSTAAVIVEVVQGEGGYIAGNTNFLSALRQKCDDCCALLIFDEIQTGMGKTGKLFAFEHHGIVPDVLLLGKALGAGMPIGAFVTSRNKMMLLADNPILGHITTFGGHPVVAAAALAGIEELLDNAWMNEVEKKEAIFRQRLVHPNIISVSGKGLMLGVQLHSFEQNLRVIQACIQEGLITDWFLFANNKIRIAPPLTITEAEIHWACDVILRNL
jgi:acetylornithine/succinyldiaminopimelate/putrescine aminotransferase